MKKIIVLGSMGAGVLLILSMMTTVVGAQTVKSNEVQTNILQQIKEKIKNNDWKPGDILHIQHLKDMMKDSGWFPGILLVLLFNLIYNSIAMFLLFLSVFVF